MAKQRDRFISSPEQDPFIVIEEEVEDNDVELTDAEMEEIG